MFVAKCLLAAKSNDATCFCDLIFTVNLITLKNIKNPTLTQISTSHLAIKGRTRLVTRSLVAIDSKVT